MKLESVPVLCKDSVGGRTLNTCGHIIKKNDQIIDEAKPDISSGTLTPRLSETTEWSGKSHAIVSGSTCDVDHVNGMV